MLLVSRVAAIPTDGRDGTGRLWTVREGLWMVHEGLGMVHEGLGMVREGLGMIGEGIMIIIRIMINGFID